MESLSKLKNLKRLKLFAYLFDYNTYLVILSLLDGLFELKNLLSVEADIEAGFIAKQPKEKLEKLNERIKKRQILARERNFNFEIIEEDSTDYIRKIKVSREIPYIVSKEIP
jgi:hypothetical protein